MNKVGEKERHINKVLQQRKKKRDRERDRESGDKKNERKRRNTENKLLN